MHTVDISMNLRRRATPCSTCQIIAPARPPPAQTRFQSGSIHHLCVQAAILFHPAKLPRTTTQATRPASSHGAGRSAGQKGSALPQGNIRHCLFQDIIPVEVTERQASVRNTELSSCRLNTCDGNPTFLGNTRQHAPTQGIAPWRLQPRDPAE